MPSGLSLRTSTGVEDVDVFYPGNPVRLAAVANVQEVEVRPADDDDEAAFMRALSTGTFANPLMAGYLKT